MPHHMWNWFHWILMFTLMQQLCAPGFVLYYVRLHGFNFLFLLKILKNLDLVL